MKKFQSKFSIFPFLFLVSCFLSPSVSFAIGFTDLSSFVDIIIDLINTLNPILYGMAFLVFFWGVAKFILNAGNEKELANGRQFMAWGVIALFILVAFWGIIQFLSTQFDFGTVNKPPFKFLPE
jgi:hypothetical protein